MLGYLGTPLLAVDSPCHYRVCYVKDKEKIRPSGAKLSWHHSYIHGFRLSWICRLFGNPSFPFACPKWDERPPPIYSEPQSPGILSQKPTPQKVYIQLNLKGGLAWLPSTRTMLSTWLTLSRGMSSATPLLSSWREGIAGIACICMLIWLIRHVAKRLESEGHFFYHYPRSTVFGGSILHVKLDGLHISFSCEYSYIIFIYK